MRGVPVTTPHKTYGLCAVVLPQVKAAGLVEAFDLGNSTKLSNE